MNILIVDDNNVTIKLIKSFLERFNHATHTATTGIDAINLYIKNNYDLVFMDLNLPNMDGITITKRMRAHSAREKFVPIVAITAYSDHEHKEACFSAGMNNFLTKPIQQQQLESILAKYSNTINPCEFLTPWYKSGANGKIRLVNKHKSYH